MKSLKIFRQGDYCVKSVLIQSSEYGEILCISPYSVQMRENANQNKYEYGQFLPSGSDTILLLSAK